MVSLSALKPSMYRKYVKGWDKGRYAELFQAHSNDRNAFRVYLSLDKNFNAKIIEPPAMIVEYLAKQKYRVEDYRAGIAVNEDGKRRMRIGKLLKDPDLKQMFDNDEQRKAHRNTHLACISRHPYDIAGSSTDRGWTSCMNLVDGEHRNHVKEDVKHGSLIAYLIEHTDKDIKRPVGRVLIKPFLQGSNVLLMCEEEVYGATVSNFVPTVQAWLDKNFNHGAPHGSYTLHKKLYADGKNTVSHYNLDDPDFWKAANTFRFSKVFKVKPGTEKVYSVSSSDEREHVLSKVNNPFERLEHVTLTDIMDYQDIDSDGAAAMVKSHWGKIIIGADKKKQFIYIKPENVVTVLDKIIRRQRLFGKLKGFLKKKVDALSLDDIAMMVTSFVSSKNAASLVDWHKFDSAKLLEFFNAVKKRGYMPSEMEGLWDVLKPESYLPILDDLIKMDVAVLALLPGVSGDLIVKHGKDLIDIMTEDQSIFNRLSVDHVQQLAATLPVMKNGRGNYGLFVDIVMADQRLRSYLPLVETICKRMPTTVSWIDRLDTQAEISVWPDELVIKMWKQHNSSLAYSVIDAKRFDLLVKMAEAAPELAGDILDSITLSDLPKTVLDNQIRVVSKVILTKGGGALSPATVRSLSKAGAHSAAIEAIDMMIANDPDALDMSKERTWWTEFAVRKTFRECPAIFNHMVKEYPWSLWAIRENLLEFRRNWDSILKAEVKGTPVQKRRINTVIKRIRELSGK